MCLVAASGLLLVAASGLRNSALCASTRVPSVAGGVAVRPPQWGHFDTPLQLVATTGPVHVFWWDQRVRRVGAWVLGATSRTGAPVQHLLTLLMPPNFGVVLGVRPPLLIKEHSDPWFTKKFSAVTWPHHRVLVCKARAEVYRGNNQSAHV